MPLSNPITVEHDARAVMPIASYSEAVGWTQSLHFSTAMQALAEKLVLERLLNSWVLTYINPIIKNILDDILCKVFQVPTAPLSLNGATSAKTKLFLKKLLGLTYVSTHPLYH